MKTPCDVIKDLLPLYHDNVCSSASKELIEDHLVECESCRRELAEFDVNILVEEPDQNDAKVIKKLSDSIKKGQKKAWLKGAAIAASTIVAFLLVFTVWFHFISVDGMSMYPTLTDNELCLVNRLSYLSEKPERGDIVFVSVNINGHSMLDVGRIIGLPGETIEIINGVLYIDGQISDLFSDEDVISFDLEGKAITVPENEYFIMGDNQKNSYDSRSDNYGTISIDNIYGKYLLAFNLPNPFATTERAEASSISN